VVLGEPGFAWENEEGETALGLDGEKVFSPEIKSDHRAFRSQEQRFVDRHVSPRDSGYLVLDQAQFFKLHTAFSGVAIGTT
jgi:hypothetical protein